MRLSEWYRFFYHLLDLLLKLLLEAFDTIVKDPTALAEARKQNIKINAPPSGAAIDELLKKFRVNELEVIKEAAEAMEPRS